ncbi:SLBB domain-containing protein [Kovacikia minuta CCNUW1]|uniref:SLBB domain-containing protein n=1 Tax=Kovacikia minuta TaxID=2931930 RepID=UPI001CCD2BB3|nr:SLBB domain-containing protein [Kovacikia minuta]UBF27186.1 SLBB domain-containing protein [Kovacikia minuta CCNUW1]
MKISFPTPHTPHPTPHFLASVLPLCSSIGLALLPVSGVAQSLRPTDSQLAPLSQAPQVPPQPATPQTAIPQITVPQVAAEGYQLGVGDRVKIDIFSVPEYSGEYQVLPDGSLNLPEIGAVPVQGKTLKEASRAISTRFEPYLTRPVVTISLLAARPVTITISGEVSRPGSYTVPAVSPTSDPNAGVPIVTRIIQLAGGTTQSADIRRIQVRRPRPGNGSADEIISVDLWQLIQAGNSRQDLPLRDGDSIVIPATTATNLNEAQQLASTSFAASNSKPLRVAIVGEVNRPGPHLLTEDPKTQTGVNPGVNNDVKQQVPTVTRAIQVAGGITQSADIRKIQVRRLTKAGSEQVIDVDFWKLLQAGDMRQDLPLQDGDTVVIPTAQNLTPEDATALASASFAPDKISVYVVGEVGRPGAVQVPPNTPLNQAILAAGGFNNRAKKGSVNFIRLNPNGTVTQRSIPIDFSQGISEANNPALRNNDTIVVGRSTLAGITDTLGSVVSPIGGLFAIFSILGL